MCVPEGVGGSSVHETSCVCYLVSPTRAAFLRRSCACYSRRIRHKGHKQEILSQRCVCLVCKSD